ncbi:DUF1194 domain-containing protein [Hoeflea sp. WL0058]|uniref:DUF1194 domain-containing protein n=1 Tax=Flavimaribacter sediminis TaxID=2865987 RepID=A0AAE3D2L2_9HYPH|nr:DUF1194 domain-containing protein [Flavimaribacter sediminis]MBW8638946.1 DUF1194 domain-containing protein [Flavimaribacter sediminis]
MTVRSLFLTLILGLAAATADAGPPNPRPTEVDLQLVLAADRSGSMSLSLAKGQRRGFADAFRDERLRNAILSGPLGRVAVVYFEWSDATDQHVVVPWTILGNSGDLGRFADRLDQADIAVTPNATSLSAALTFARQLVDANGLTSHRIVVDVSGNGRNTQGPSMEAARDDLRAIGAVVNGLVLPDTTYAQGGPYGMMFSGYDGPLTDYFEASVICGPGAFALDVELPGGIAGAILRKLVLEVAWTGKEGISHDQAQRTIRR